MIDTAKSEKILFWALLLALCGGIVIYFCFSPLYRSPVAVGTMGETHYTNAKLQLNHAAWQELTLLPGIGEVRAKAIVERRTENGLFDSYDKLLEIDGIGYETVDILKRYTILSGKPDIGVPVGTLKEGKEKRR